MNNNQDEEWEPDLPLTELEHLGPLGKLLSDMESNNYIKWLRRKEELKRYYTNVQEKEESKEISEETRRAIARTTEEVEQ